MPAQYNSYGFSGGFAAICAGISWILVQNRACKINVVNLFSDTFNDDNLQIFHYIAIVVGLILFVLSFFNFAGVLYQVRLLFIATILGILATGAMMFYATYVAFNLSCKSALNNVFDTASLGGARNVFDAQDGVGITITILDLLCALALISAAIGFTRTY